MIYDVRFLALARAQMRNWTLLDPGAAGILIKSETRKATK